ncbi:mucin-like protein [Xenia sp. Carnegie-2017]|uniref:mucin-like protein n=1 Tax=Xenia sp. Carnegie-2017 TaxID=2897299 RepID=UPI001F04B7E1|nr:mucin-like protein [Xenia sp. Carnegie-2017]
MGTLRLMKKSLTSAFLCLVFTNFMIEVSGNISSQRFNSAFDTAEQIKIEFQYEGNSPTTQRANCFEVSFPETRFNFKGRFYSSVYICANGMVRFDGPEYAANPINFGIFSSLPIIAPYWSQVDLRFLNNSNSNVTYRLYQNSNENTAVFDTINTVVETNTEIKNYSANWVLVVTWVCLAPRQPVDNNFPERNTFQLLLADDLFNGAFTLFIYESITWSFGVNRNEYTNFRDASDLPVIGFDSGRRDITPRFQIYETSGTINADRVGDEMTILYDLRSPFPRSNAEECQIWVNQQLISPTRRSSCRNNCAQDLQTAYLNLTGVFFTLFRRVKGSGPTPNFCIYSGTTLDGADECCYQYTGQLESYPQSFNSTAVNSFSSFTISESSALGAAPGRWHEVHPRENFTKYLQEEQRYNQCCVDAGSTQESCDQFYRVRPICIGVSFEFVSTWANNFGDPHFVTLDRKNYTFNGCGWYTYFIGQIPGNDASSLEVQVRTTRVGNANATGFTAFAIKEGNSQVIQVNLNTTTKGLDVRVGGMLIPPPGENGIIRNGTAITFADNLLQISTPLGNGARVNVVNGSFFTLVMLFLDGYRNNSFGLSGRWNGNMTDDFTHSDRKTITPIDADERAIFHYFGESWKVNETNGQGIYMNVDEGINTFSCQNFTPAFFDELENNNTNFTMEAREACGSNTFCLFDALATQNIAIGQSTRDEQRLTDNVIAQVENIPPEFTTNTSLITANLNETLTVTLEAQDMDANDILTFDVPNLPSVSSFNVSGNTLTFTWTANSTAVVDLKFVVSDSRNRTAVLTPRVQICACRDKSTCVVPEGRKCYLHIDECARNTSGCEQICTNNLASFSCGCSPGFTISANGRTCIDIDECLRPNNCSQVCENTVGSFSCNCRQGFELEADGEQCRVRTNCSQNGNCAQICFVDDNGNDTCACAKGYALGSDGRSCNDINECENVGTCSQQCMNTDGSFMCGCFPGYTLASDMFSCEDIDECSDLTRQTCNITNGEDCINIPGSFTCRCAARLNLIRVNNICVCEYKKLLVYKKQPISLKEFL